MSFIRRFCFLLSIILFASCGDDSKQNTKETYKTSEVSKYLIFKNLDTDRLVNSIVEFSKLPGDVDGYIFQFDFYVIDNWLICHANNNLSLYDFTGIVGWTCDEFQNGIGIFKHQISPEKTFFMAFDPTDEWGEIVGGISESNKRYEINMPDMWIDLPIETYTERFAVDFSGNDFIKEKTYIEFMETFGFNPNTLDKLNKPSKTVKIKFPVY